MKDGGLEDQRAGGLEGNTGLAGDTMQETCVKARVREHEAIKVGGLEGTWAGGLEGNTGLEGGIRESKSPETRGDQG